MRLNGQYQDRNKMLSQGCGKAANAVAILSRRGIMAIAIDVSGPKPVITVRCSGACRRLGGTVSGYVSDGGRRLCRMTAQVHGAAVEWEEPYDPVYLARVHGAI